MTKSAFAADPAARSVTRLLLVLQLAGMVLAILLRLLGFAFPALCISVLMLTALAGAVFWLYFRYRSIPAVREKHRLESLHGRFVGSLDTDTDMLQAAIHERGRLSRAEKDEIARTLERLQTEHLQAGLAAASIPELRQGLPERLANYGVVSALQVTDALATIPALGEAERQALVDWRNSLAAELKRAQPGELSSSQLGVIRQKYQPMREQNDIVYRRALASKQVLEHELTYFKPRLSELAPLSFTSYLGSVVTSSRLTAGLLATAVVAAQLVTAVAAVGPLLPAGGTSPAGVTALVQAFEPASTWVPTALPTPSAAPSQVASPTSPATLMVQAPLPPGVPACIPQDSPRETARVLGVTDGDTIEVSIDGQIFRVRYIGINSPEQDQPLYAEAWAYNQALVNNQTVTLVKDISETDRFDRLLRYVIVGDTFVNEEMVAQGYAEAQAYAPDTACVSDLETAQQLARSAAAGLWLPTEAFVPPVTGGEGTPGCEPAYPGVCIPPPPPDLDCGDITFRRFQVLPPDPHRFDGDADGVGCEG